MKITKPKIVYSMKFFQTPFGNISIKWLLNYHFYDIVFDWMVWWFVANIHIINWISYFYTIQWKTMILIKSVTNAFSDFSIKPKKKLPNHQKTWVYWFFRPKKSCFWMEPHCCKWLNSSIILVRGQNNSVIFKILVISRIF